MGLVVLLVPSAPEQVSLGAGAAAALAELGITSVALVRGAGVSGLVLDGWAFDPGRAQEAAAAVGASAATALTTVARMAVSAAASSGEQAGSLSTPLAHGRVEPTKHTIGKEE